MGDGMMTAIAFLTRKVGFDSGVVVSIRHLRQTLAAQGVASEYAEFGSDEELVRLARESSARYLDIHVPSFSDEAFDQVMQTGKTVMLSIHSTLCNLQAEEGMLLRLFRLGRRYQERLLISCPSFREVVAMNAIQAGRFVYLPNTFSYEMLTETEAEEQGRIRLQAGRRQISLFSAYRPLKNLPVQVAAACICAQDTPLELHFSHGEERNPLYQAVMTMTEMAGVPTVVHPQMKNREFYQSLDGISVLLQVSLSETLSYVALEHMARGIPVVGSSSIPFAVLQADYSDVQDIAAKLRQILVPETYLDHVGAALAGARCLIEENNQQAGQTIKAFLKGGL